MGANGIQREAELSEKVCREKDKDAAISQEHWWEQRLEMEH